MGIVWEAYHKGVPLLGVPANPIDIVKQKKKGCLVGGWVSTHLKNMIVKMGGSSSSRDEHKQIFETTT